MGLVKYYDDVVFLHHFFATYSDVTGFLFVVLPYIFRGLPYY
jgi:hypothetical protein